MKNNPHQLKWDLRHLSDAETRSTWSKDPSTGVGAVIIDPRNRFVSGGFNGPPHGFSATEDAWFTADRTRKLAVTLHAELNAILFAHHPLIGCTIYTYPLPPCAACAAIIRQIGIIRVVFPSITLETEAYSRWTKSFDLASRIYGKDIILDHIDYTPHY